MLYVGRNLDKKGRAAGIKIGSNPLTWLDAKIIPYSLDTFFTFFNPYTLKSKNNFKAIRVGIHIMFCKNKGQNLQYLIFLCIFQTPILISISILFLLGVKINHDAYFNKFFLYNI